MQKQVKISGKSKENMSLLKHLKGDVQGKELVIEDSIVNERWKQVLKEKIDIEHDLFNYQKIVKSVKSLFACRQINNQ